MPRNLIRQFEQIRGTYTFFDDLFRQYAEQTGRHYFTGTLSVVSGSTTVVDSATNFEEDELANFVVIDSGPEAGVYQITSCSGSLDAEVTPAVSGTNASTSYRRHYYQNIEDDLNYIRKMLQLMSGESEWYDDPAIDLSTVASELASISGSSGDFIGLVDTPSTYLSQGGKTVAVNTGATALEFIAGPSPSLDGGTADAVYGGTVLLDGGAAASFP